MLQEEFYDADAILREEEDGYFDDSEEENYVNELDFQSSRGDPINELESDVGEREDLWE